MAGPGHRAGGGLGLRLSVASLAACSATPAPASTAPVHPTALAACTDALGDGWQVAVKMDRANGSTLALVKGASIATCQTWSNPEGTDFGNAASGGGTYPTPSPAALSYLTSSRTGRLAPFFVGRVPASARTVRVSYLDGSEQEAVLGGGLWLAWPDAAGVGAPTRIEALDASGRTISHLADPAGVEPAG